MRCPVCGSNIADGLTICPACHADLSATRVIPKLKGTWCPSCGALIPAGAASCPKCGMRVEAPVPRAISVPEVPEEEDDTESEEDETRTLPRIESAIPSEPDPAIESMYGREPLPHTRVFIVAAIASLLIVGGATLAITHPWNPSLSDPRAATPADTSQAGFPGTVARLQGQDVDEQAPTSVPSSDEVTYAALVDAYEQLGKISDRADKSTQHFHDAAIAGTDEERKQAAQDAQQISLDASNLVGKIKNINVITTGTYTDQRDHIATLASWLRNRTDTLSKAWDLSAKSSNPQSDAAKIKAAMKGQSVDNAESYAALFAKNYEAWKPVQR